MELHARYSKTFRIFSLETAIGRERREPGIALVFVEQVFRTANASFRRRRISRTRIIPTEGGGLGRRSALDEADAHFLFEDVECANPAGVRVREDVAAHFGREAGQQTVGRRGGRG